MKFCFCLIFLLAYSAALAQEQDWKEFHSPRGMFSVEMPGTPSDTTLIIPTELGNLSMRMYSLDGGSVALAYVDYPSAIIAEANPDSLLNGARNGAIANVAGELVNEQRIEVEGHRGREIEATAYNGLGILRARVILVGRRLYMMMVAAPGEQDLPDYHRIFNSFKLDHADAFGRLQTQLRVLGYEWELSDGQCKIVLKFDDNRSQLVYITTDPSTFFDGDAFVVWSPVFRTQAPLPDSVQQKLFGLNEMYDLGSFYLMHDSEGVLVTMSARVDGFIDALQLQRGIIAIASASDQTEAMFSGLDEY